MINTIKEINRLTGLIWTDNGEVREGKDSVSTGLCWISNDEVLEAEQ